MAIDICEFVAREQWLIVHASQATTTSHSAAVQELHSANALVRCLHVT